MRLATETEHDLRIPTVTNAPSHLRFDDPAHSVRGRHPKAGLSTLVAQRGTSGVGQYLIALVHGLTQCAPSFQMNLFVLEGDLPLFRFAARSMNLISVPEIYRSPLRNVWWHQAILPSLVRRHRIETLHIPSYRRLLWRRPCALVATIHDVAPFSVRGKYDWKRMVYGRFMVRRFSRRQDEIIAVSEFTAAEIAQHAGIAGDRITVIHNGVDHSRFFPGSRVEAQTRVQARHGVRDPFFLYVARLEHPAKNHVRLIAAFEQFKRETHLPWRLVLAGSDWNGAEVIHQTIRASSFSSAISALGFVGDPDLPDLYRAAEAMVYPSLFEGFGMPPIEAMACGCPVICSNRGALGEVVGGAAAIVDPEEIGSIKRQMERVAIDSNAREHWRLAGLDHARQFDWRRAAESTLAAYARAAARHARGG